MRGHSLFRALALSASILLAGPWGSSVARAESVPPDPRTPLEWQRVVLEEQLHSKLNRIIGQNIQPHLFAITVSISLKPKTKPEQQKEKAADGSNPRGNDVRPPIGKLGVDMSLLLAAAQRKGDGPAPDLPSVFDSIQSVNVTILLDQTLSDSKIPVVRTLAQGMLASVSPSGVRVDVQKADVYSDPNKKEEPPKGPEATATPTPAPAASPTADGKTDGAKEDGHWDMRRWVVEMKYPAGFVLGSFILGLIVLLIFSGYRGLESRKLALMEAKAAREDEAAARDRNAGAGGGAAAGPGAHAAAEAEAKKLAEMKETGIDRFQKLLNEAPERATQLVRQWIRNPRRGAGEALTLIPQILKMDNLKPIFDRLSAEEKKEWRNFLALPLPMESMAHVQDFIASQIVENFLIPHLPIDEELRRLMNSLSLSECVELSRQDSSAGSLLTNLLPAGQVARVFSLLPAESAQEIISASVRVSDAELVAQSGKLKKVIQGIKAKAKQIRFLENATELLQEVGPERESAIFSSLADAGEYHTLEAAARHFFPAELLLRLPPHVLKSCLELLPMEKRAELIFSRPPEERETLLEIYGKKGARLREMIDLEVDRVKTDDFRRKRAERNRSVLWKDLAEACRQQIRTDESVAELASVVLNGWLYERSSGEVGKQEDSNAA